MQGPDPYLRELALALPCAVHPKRAAILDAEHRAFVNFETYYVSDAEALAAFTLKPHAYTGRVTDPVTRTRFLPDETSPRRDLSDRVYYFESRETASTFDADPAAYETPMLSMQPKTE